jgi:hypothetical protein
MAALLVQDQPQIVLLAITDFTWKGQLVEIPALLENIRIA